MNGDKFSQQIEAVSQRLTRLHERADGSPAQYSEILADAFAELDTALHELQAVEEELHRQYEELLDTRQAVESERQRYQDLFNFAPDGYLVTDPHGIIQEANRAAADLLNTPQRFLIGKPLALFIPAEEQNAFRRQLYQLRQVNRLQEWEVCMQPHKRRPLYVALTVAADHDWADRLVALRWLLRDITKRKVVEEQVRALNAELEHRVRERTAQLVAANKAKDELLERERDARATAEVAERRFRELVQSLDAIVCEADPLTCRFTFVSQRAEDLLGYPVKRWLAEPEFWSSLIHPEDRTQAISLYQAALQSGHDHEFECRMIAADGRVVWLHHRIYVVRDNAGQPRQLRGLMVDVTERKWVEEALRENEERFRAIFEGAAIGIGLVDAQGHTVESNPALQRMLGYSAEELRSLVFTEITHPDDLSADWSLFEELTEGRRDSYQLEKRYIRKDGQVMWGRLTISLARQPGAGCQLGIGMVEDITERKRVATELAKVQRRLTENQEDELRHQARELHDNTVQQLLGISYHLAALRVKANTDQASCGLGSVELTTALDSIHAEVLKVVKQLRGMIGTLRPAGLEELGLTAALEGYLSRLQRERGHSIPEIDADLDECGTCLPQPVALCLFRAAQEALRNSLKHAQAGHITLRLRLSADEVVLSVCDDGCDFDVPPRLSELTQAEHFGLVGIAERVAWIGGQLSIRSYPGQGTELTVCIPVSETELSDERDDSRTAGR